jgi:hypothetical protein
MSGIAQEIEAMPQVNIPDTLFSEIEKAIRLPISPEDFVVAAVREKLSWESRKEEFFRLSDGTWAAMLAKGLSEGDILRDFASVRQELSEPTHG